VRFNEGGNKLTSVGDLDEHRVDAMPTNRVPEILLLTLCKEMAYLDLHFTRGALRVGAPSVVPYLRRRGVPVSEEAL
jgi:hypothetical protein